MLTLNLTLTAENEIMISYIQHRKPVISHSNKPTTPDSTVVPLNHPYERNSSQSNPILDEPGSLNVQQKNTPATGCCTISFEAPPGKVLSILFLNQTCSRDNQVYVQDNYDGWSTTLDGCSPRKTPGYDVTTANRSAVMAIDLNNLTEFYRLKIQIKAAAEWKRTKFNIRYVSPALGYIQNPGWHPFTRPLNDYGWFKLITAAVVVPSNASTLISVVHNYIALTNVENVGATDLLTVKRGSRKSRLEWRFLCKATRSFTPRVLTGLSQFRLEMKAKTLDFFHGVRVLFSFHQPLRTPHRLRGHPWNCSVTFWPDFSLHLMCNNWPECIGKKDEMWCLDISCHHGGLLLDEVCHFFIALKRGKNTWQHAKTGCQQEGATLAHFPTVRSWYNLAVLSHTKDARYVIYIGLQTPDSKHPHIIPCPDKHRTHDFLACDAFSACWHDQERTPGSVNVLTDMVVIPDCADVDVTSFSLFPCQNGASSVPYSLVCNHLQDCVDNSDEDFCVFPHCSHVSQYMCANGQCLPTRHYCDDIVHCVDESDEADCTWSNYLNWLQKLPLPPAVADFDGRGRITYTPLLTTGSESLAVMCPDTHVFCPGDGYCLPVYVRCNGLYDCPGHEDEDDCNSYTCPGFYRCRGLSNTCLHPDYLCDGWSQCLQHDDEQFCNLTCPVNCICRGHAFTCYSDFHVDLFSRLRYLDAGGTNLKPKLLVNNLMLVYLSLANCTLANLDNLALPNLVNLDLSDNRFSVLTAAELNLMQNLQNLSVARNPLSRLFFSNYSSAFIEHKHILHVDLNGVLLKVLDVPIYLPFPSLLSLNLSGSGVTHVIGEGFRSLLSLRIIDLRGCPVTVFPIRVFKKLNDLQLVFANNYKLCCEANLPEDFSVSNCQAPFNEISSCDALLRTDVYRVCHSVLAALALSGNLGCFSLRIFSRIHRRRKTGFNVFVTHLCVSDFVMGVYMAMIGVADRIYLGRYLWEEDRWRDSTACQVAGVLALLSSEVSAFIICLITLDRFLVIRFPFSRLCLSSFSAQVAGLMTWTVGFVLVTVPLLPVTAYKHFYSQTGICVPLPVTRHDFDGQHYAFGVMILLNLVIFLIIATGQMSVYLSMTNNAMSSMDATRKSRDLNVARRLITVVVSDFLCWFPLGLVGVLAAQGVPIPGEVNVAMAIFVLPLNSALNPFLYTLNMIQEKRQRAAEVKLLSKLMHSRSTENKNINEE